MRRNRLILAGIALTLATALASLCIGASSISLVQLLAALGLGRPSPETWTNTVITEVRLPRMLLALSIGATLAQCGVVLQALFRNPLAEPGLLGISGGAAFAVACALALAPALGAHAIHALPYALPLIATIGALLATGIVMALARTSGVTDIAGLLLAGVSINALAGAGIALLQTLVSDSALRDLTVWMYGSLGRADWAQLSLGLPLLLGIALWLPREAAALDALLLGEAEAAHLGVNIETLKRRLLLLVALATATTVALAGMIGFIGLIAPHLLRLVFGPGHRLLLPASALLGASLLVIADTAARSLFAPLEVPVGVLTALVGVPLFLSLLRARGVR